MRRKPPPADPTTDLLLVAGLSGHNPGKIDHWTLFVIDDAGDGFVYSSACCAHHAGEIIPRVMESRLSALPPCRGRDG